MAPGVPPGELTATERRIADMVAEGYRNRRIAQTLFVSPATIEAHLTRTYRELGIRSRRELAPLVRPGRVGISRYRRGAPASYGPLTGPKAGADQTSEEQAMACCRQDRSRFDHIPTRSKHDNDNLETDEPDQCRG